MLFAASESAVTKKPRLRFTMSRSSSVSPFGFFHVAMSRFMLISCGIQWLAQPFGYFSHAHLYLKGTSWFTSVFALMTRLSSARTRVFVGADFGGAGSAGFGASAGVVRPDGVEWSSCRPGVGTGVSSSKLSISCDSSGVRCAPLFVGVVGGSVLRCCLLLGGDEPRRYS